MKKKITLTLFIVTSLLLSFCNCKSDKTKEQNNTIPVVQKKTPEEIQHEEKVAEEFRQQVEKAVAEKKAAELVEQKQELAEQKQWENSKGGKIQKKHPDWSKEDCERIADRKIWIGMTLDMLKYLRGKPSSANPSNYGSGIEWQWCWDDYTPSCFYGGDDGIITSYN